MQGTCRKAQHKQMRCSDGTCKAAQVSTSRAPSKARRWSAHEDDNRHLLHGPTQTGTSAETEPVVHIAAHQSAPLTTLYAKNLHDGGSCRSSRIAHVQPTNPRRR